MKRVLKNIWARQTNRFICLLFFLPIGLLGLVMLFEEKLIYFPMRSGRWEVDHFAAGEGEIVPKIEDSWFTTEDGLKLHGWYCVPHRITGGQPVPVPAEMVLLWFHGNAGNITHRYEMIRLLSRMPVKIFIIDYRGYGRSEGSPSEQGLYLDARAAWDYLIAQRGLRPDQIVIFGKSLGGAPAIDLASRVQPAGLIVQSSFTSIPDMAATILPFFPKSLLRTRMDSLSKIPGVRCPKLFIHSPSDEVVPYRLGRRLYEAAAEPKQFYEVKGAPHNETFLVGGQAYFEALRSFLNSCAARRAAETQR